jgi:hypothetical protein
VPSPAVQVRVPEPVLAAIDEARGPESRSAWILGAVGLRLSPLAEVAEVVAAVTKPPPGLPSVIPVAVIAAPQREKCPHPKARVHKGLCGNCGTGGLG